MSSDVSMSVQMKQWRLLSCVIPLCVRLMRLRGLAIRLPRW